MTEICQTVTGVSAPVLFLDTCILLDIIRLPYRYTLDLQSCAAAKNIIDNSSVENRKVWLATSETVHGEWEANAQSVQSELDAEISNVEKTRSRIFSIASDLLNKPYDPGHNTEMINLGSALLSMSEKLLNTCEIASVEEKHSYAGMYRVRKNIPPAKRGKPEAQDCEIFETFLALGHALRQNGFNDRICFVTSNTNDYCLTKKCLVQNDLDKIEAEFVTNLQWAGAIADGRA
nr:PIN domain-containing protein [Nitrosomonas marina]